MTKRTFDKIAAGLNEALATAPPRLTEAQKRALEWLPADMSFRFPTRLSDPNYLDLVDLGDMGLAECACDVVAAMDCDHSYRLTPAGIAAREKMEKHNA